ncbi:MAG: DNA mismatch repair endonuclease MutL [Flavobacteriales bacterium]|nr:DNA mismatch repair endonuclease MutL [Flavobacteriales bacterium]
MENVINLLPDAVANQIAAGEVIQRPASAVKELMENSIDSGAEKIQLIIKDAGKTLIQVIDDGCGMTEQDARMSFERHATSKINTAQDLFALCTKGFRGEALASVCAVAHIEMKTRRAKDELGFHLINEGSKITKQEAITTPVGTSVSVKNLFYNIPARRKFLKSTSVETRHIIDEFQRVALIHPEIAFELINNDTEVYNLPKGNFRQRIVSVFGKSFDEKLVPIEEDTDIVGVAGFFGKPEFAKKTRGEQFFFVNKRFIKNSYLNHAIAQAMDDLLPPKAYPTYFIQLEIDPAEVDINIHPTKTEVKFGDEKSIYAILRAATKRSLNRFKVAPTLDFNQETSFNSYDPEFNGPISEPKVQVDSSFNPFEKPKEAKAKSWSSGNSFKTSSAKGSFDWKNLYEQDKDLKNENFDDLLGDIEFEEEHEQTKLIKEDINKFTFVKQIYKQYIQTFYKGNLIFIDQKRAHERVLYEYFQTALKEQKKTSQQLLFPESISLQAADAELLKSVLPDLQQMGIDINEFGPTDFVVNGLPSDLHELNAKQLIEQLIEQFKLNGDEVKIDKREALTKSMSRNIAIKKGQKLEVEEMSELVNQLFDCESPFINPYGKTTFFNFTLEEISDKLDK